MRTGRAPVGRAGARWGPGTGRPRDAARRHRRTATGTADTGMATVFTTGAVAVLVVLAGVVWTLGAAVVARHRAAGAADLAALAAAGAAHRGTGAACARADVLGDRMRVRIAECRLDGWDALVVTTVDTAGLPLSGPATARARAGPVEEESPAAGSGRSHATSGRPDTSPSRPGPGGGGAVWSSPGPAAATRSAKRAPAWHGGRATGPLPFGPGVDRLLTHRSPDAGCRQPVPVTPCPVLE